MNILRFAAIDIGSNAVRLLVQDAIEFPSRTEFNKVALVRVPLRLGQDVFTQKMLSQESISRLISTINGYKHLMEAYRIIDYRTCATSAMREAKNGREVVEKIWKETGVKIEIIDGDAEAHIIFSTHIAELIDANKSYLYVDVGGGSTEITIFSNNAYIGSISFPIGTVRLLNDMVSKETWDSLRKWLADIRTEYKDLSIIGSGGNINKIFSMTRKKPGKPMEYDELKEMYTKMKKLTMEERIRDLRLNPHRADVIVPAAKIYTTIMKEAACKKIYIPQIGLNDGLIRTMYMNYRREETLSME